MTPLLSRQAKWLLIAILALVIILFFAKWLIALALLGFACWCMYKMISDVNEAGKRKP